MNFLVWVLTRIAALYWQTYFRFLSRNFKLLVFLKTIDIEMGTQTNMEPVRGRVLIFSMATPCLGLKRKNVEKNSGLINTQWSHQKANQDQKSEMIIFIFQRYIVFISIWVKSINVLNKCLYFFIVGYFDYIDKRKQIQKSNINGVFWSIHDQGRIRNSLMTTSSPGLEGETIKILK